MQFHLNGFYPGDPAFSDPEDRVVAPPPRRPLPPEVDVMVVGCGPAGLNLAAQLAQFANIHTCIVDQKSDRLLIGQADGIACRTVELFQAFGFAHEIIREGFQVCETSFWKPSVAQPGWIERSNKVQDVEDDLSEMPHLIINQARVHDRYLEVMRRGPARIEPYYSRRLVGLDVAARDMDYPVTLQFAPVADGRSNHGKPEVVKARYVVGCDGARSAVRTLIGRELVGDALNQAWGVMDALIVTDFPDTRLKTAIQSSHEGNMLIIPREGGYMVRLYVELDKLKENERISRSDVTPDYLLAAMNRIIRPYTIEVKEVCWWSVYEIGQRLTTAFDDASESQLPRVFLAGDACHTHSPKAGQGLNTSVNDTWNLGWKLAHVLSRRAAPELLLSYSAERQAVAKQLIDFDREWSAMFSAKPRSESNPQGVDPADFQRYFQRFGGFTAGTSIRYSPSELTGTGAHQALAKGLTVGMRFHSAPVVRHADAKPMHLGHSMTAQGKWYLFAFAGPQIPMSETCRVRALCDFLHSDPASPPRRYTPPGADPDSVIDVRAVFQQHHQSFDPAVIHSVLAPTKGRYALRDYEKVYCPDAHSGVDLFDLRGIDREQGCLVLVRPDHYVADVLPLDAYDALVAFFDRVLLPTTG